jgi:hypothetical protein
MDELEMTDHASAEAVKNPQALLVMRNANDGRGSEDLNNGGWTVKLFHRYTREAQGSRIGVIDKMKWALGLVREQQA